MAVIARPRLRERAATRMKPNRTFPLLRAEHVDHESPEDRDHKRLKTLVQTTKARRPKPDALWKAAAGAQKISGGSRSRSDKRWDKKPAGNLTTSAAKRRSRNSIAIIVPVNSTVFCHAVAAPMSVADRLNDVVAGKIRK